MYLFCTLRRLINGALAALSAFFVIQCLLQIFRLCSFVYAAFKKHGAPAAFSAFFLINSNDNFIHTKFDKLTIF